MNEQMVRGGWEGTPKKEADTLVDERTIRTRISIGYNDLRIKDPYRGREPAVDTLVDERAASIFLDRPLYRKSRN